MKRIIGIDIGGSTTKIVGLFDNKLVKPIFVKANDPIASVYGAFGKFLNINRLELSEIDKIAITGVGSSYVSDDLHGIPTQKVDEFRAIGRGGLYLSSIKKAIVVSMGTGTAYIIADEEDQKHIGGTGVGGGTLLGLSNKMLNIRHFNDLIEMAKNGDLQNVDLNISDISRDEMETLPSHITASNFGKISDLATKSDIAMGIINLVFQTIGMMAVFATRIYNTKNVVLTGNLIQVPQSKAIFETFNQLYDIHFYSPKYAEFATAVGAALSANNNIK